MTPEAIIDRWTKAEEAITAARPRWRAARAYCTQEKAALGTAGFVTQTAADKAKTPALYDLTAETLANELASSFLHWVADPAEKWASLQPPLGIKDKSAQRACDEATEVIFEHIADSNFYSEAQELLVQFVVDGTISQGIDWSADESKLFFRNHRCGTFGYYLTPTGALSEWLGLLTFTAKQAVDEYGMRNLPKEVQDDARDSAKCNTPHVFIRCIYKRDDKKINAKRAAAGDVRHLPIASVHIHKATKQIVKESGFVHIPMAVCTYRDVSLDDSFNGMFGGSPGQSAAPIARSLNQLAKDEITGVGVMVDPRIVAVKGALSGPIDLRRGGSTWVETMQERPQEWGTSIDLRAIEFATARRERQLEKIFLTSLSRQFSMVDKQMTVPEVMARQREALTVFGPPTGKLMGRWLTSHFNAAFVLLYQNGKLPQFPESMMVQGQLMPPKVRMTSKVAMALEALGENGFLSTLQTVSELAQIDPSLLNVLDIKQGVRNLARARGVKTEVIRTEAQVEEIEAEQAAARAEAMQAESLAKLAGNPGTLKAANELSQ